MKPGEHVSLTTATSGGFGDPTECNQELIERDIRLGYITEERAHEVYNMNANLLR
jgi:N-methylhydantoinase B/oxoprolinase/acetone carboxylase alpha subunit